MNRGIGKTLEVEKTLNYVVIVGVVFDDALDSCLNVCHGGMYKDLDAVEAGEEAVHHRGSGKVF